MPINLDEIALLLRCPDDGGTVSKSCNGLRCVRCHRFYPVLPTNILELLPSQPRILPENDELATYRDGYLKEFFRPREIRSDAKAWGASESRTLKWLRLRERQVSEVFLFLQYERRETKLIFCDLSAGAGYCTFRAAQEYRVVFHCDLSIDALVYASAKAAAARLDNMVFVHADYLQPPFRNVIDHLTCLDTLIRGTWHEMRLLQSIRTVLAKRGVAVVDFHNWWHNPLRRFGLLPNNFVGNKSYTRKELTALLAKSGIELFQTQSFVQEIDSRRPAGKILARFIPATRLMVRLPGVGASPSQTPF